MRHPLLAPDLKELIAQREDAALREFFGEHHPADAAELLDDLAPTEVIYVLLLLEPRPRAEAFAYLDAPLQDAAAGLMERSTLAALIARMSHDERADLISRLPEERVEQILPLLAQAEREDIRRLAAYEEGTAGAVMTSDYALVPADITAATAIERLRHEAPDRETIYYCYVVDEHRRLVGIVSLKDLILAPPARPVAQIMKRTFISANVGDDQESAARKLMEYDLIALPVVDADHKLVGIVTYDDVIDVIVDEATEDVYRLGAVAPLEDSYLRTSFLTLWSKRIVWLAVLFVGGFLTTTALGWYEHTFSELPALVLFVPLIISAGGNCGSQSATLITRALALGEITPGDWGRILLHEIAMGLLLGAGLAVVGFVRALLVPTEKLTGLPGAMQLGWVVGLAVAVVVLCGNLVGAILPLVLKRIGLDPAFMSNPVVASLVDVTGIVSYFAIAQALL